MAEQTFLPSDLLRSEQLPSLRKMENRYVRYVLDRVGGNKRQAASLLGVSRRTLYRHL
jgi:transcriptional regulator with PAS, ATPase and Fis domain